MPEPTAFEPIRRAGRDARPAALQPLRQRLGPRGEVGARMSVSAPSAAAEERHRQHRDVPGDARHQSRAARSAVTSACGSVEEVGQRQRRAEADRGMPNWSNRPVRRCGRAAVRRSSRIDADRGAEAPFALGMGRRQHPVLDHPVIVERDRHEDHVVPARPVARDDIAEQPELRGSPTAPVEAEPAFGEDRLGHAFRGRHLDVAREHPAIERVAGLRGG